MLPMIAAPWVFMDVSGEGWLVFSLCRWRWSKQVGKAVQVRGVGCGGVGVYTQQ